MNNEIISNIEKIILDIEYINDKERLSDYIYDFNNYYSDDLTKFMDLYIIDQLNERFESFDSAEVIVSDIKTKLEDLTIVMNYNN